MLASMNLTTRIILAMLVGLGLGMLAQVIADGPDHFVTSVLVDGIAGTGGDIFLRLFA